MLPSAKSSLIDGGFSPKAAAWTLIGCFLGGAIVIQLVSRVLHHFMPSHTVDCEHTHDEANGKEADNHSQDDDHHDYDHSHGDDHEHRPRQPRSASNKHTHRPRLASANQSAIGHQTSHHSGGQQNPSGGGDTHLAPPKPTGARRPSLQARISQKFSNITNKKTACDCDGPCYGFTEPCGTDCFKKVQARGSFRNSSSRSLRRSATRSRSSIHEASNESTPLLQDRYASDSDADNVKPTPELILEEDEGDSSNSPTLVENRKKSVDDTKSNVSGSGGQDGENEEQADHHHHHVPTNAFLSIGLQTSIAIALHKLPEGFITYATNHANPKLGFSVFLALFIHNITEGFALALPLYLAIGSRPKAMFWSFILGGCSQPLGAGVAALWFHLAGSGNLAPGEGVYGGMFAVTAGIMASVALQLFSESLDLTHNRGLCMIFAFVGMGILGVSSALTA